MEYKNDISSLLEYIENLFEEGVYQYQNENIEEALINLEQAVKLIYKIKNVINDFQFYNSFLEIEIGVYSLLGTIYQQREVGDKNQNIENAIDFLEKTLEMILPSDYDQLSIALVTLGKAYFDRISGNKSENIEKTIKLIEEAINYFNSETDEILAEGLNILGQAYLERILGDKNQNIEKSIEYNEKSLEIFSLLNE